VYILQGTDVAHFGHPFSLDLYYDINRLDSTTVIRDNLPKWPQIFFEVVSLDEWSRCRTEGYGYISIPVNAGSYDNVNVETWRPVLPGPITEMKRYFVGGTPELDDLSYCGTPASVSDSAILSRYGFRTMTSGKIKLRMYVMHQAKAFLTPTGGATSKMASKWKRHHLMDRLASATLFSSLSAVLEAFKKARERITQATEGYDVDTPVLA
jgi:Meckel syndrome type 1 protein